MQADPRALTPSPIAEREELERTGLDGFTVLYRHKKNGHAYALDVAAEAYTHPEIAAAFGEATREGLGCSRCRSEGETEVAVRNYVLPVLEGECLGLWFSHAPILGEPCAACDEANTVQADLPYAGGRRGAHLGAS